MTSSTRTDFLLQLLQKVGSPLTAATVRHSSGNPQDDARVLATMLSESVKISIGLSQALNLKTEDGDADAIRVALAKLSAGLVAESYAQTGRIPGDGESTKITKLLESVIVFSANFAPSEEHTKRLKMLDSTPPFFDPVQINLYVMNALLPVLSAVAEFSFGQPETKLVADIAARLQTESKQVLSTLGNVNPVDELVALQALSNLYASVHKSHVAAFKQTSGDAAPSIEQVWKEFSLRRAMVDVLLGATLKDTAASQTSSSGGGVSPAPQAESAPVQAPQAQQATGGGSPMSFFKKK